MNVRDPIEVINAAIRDAVTPVVAKLMLKDKAMHIVIATFARALHEKGLLSLGELRGRLRATADAMPESPWAPAARYEIQVLDQLLETQELDGLSDAERRRRLFRVIDGGGPGSPPPPGGSPTGP